jgi:hypothetical protein
VGSNGQGDLALRPLRPFLMSTGGTFCVELLVCPSGQRVPLTQE